MPVRRALLALLLAVPLVATGGTADAAGCSAQQVTVVVQYLGGGAVTRCTRGDPNTGVEALTSAGFSYTYSPREPGFVCTINGNPGNRDCMKPRYWSYWHATQPGAKWTYSSEGAGTYNPAPGSVEGWRFDCGAAPGGASKCATSSPKPSPKPSPRPAPKPSTHATTGSGAQAGSGASPSTTGKAGTVSAEAKAKAKAKAKANARDTAKAKATKAKAKAKKKPAAAAAVVSASATPSQDTIANAAASQSVPRASEPPRRGTLPWWWGAIALVLIGGTAGAVTVVRRR